MRFLSRTKKSSELFGFLYLNSRSFLIKYCFLCLTFFVVKIYNLNYKTWKMYGSEISCFFSHSMKCLITQYIKIQKWKKLMVIDDSWVNAPQLLHSIQVFRVNCLYCLQLMVNSSTHSHNFRHSHKIEITNKSLNDVRRYIKKWPIQNYFFRLADSKSKWK